MSYNNYNKFKAIVLHEMPELWGEIQKQPLNTNTLAYLKLRAMALISYGGN